MTLDNNIIPLQVTKMSMKKKKDNTGLPFTQLWCNYAKQAAKSKASGSKPAKEKTNPFNKQYSELFSSDLYPNSKQRRASLNFISKRPDISNSHERASMILLNNNRDKENYHGQCNGRAYVDESCLSFANANNTSLKENYQEYSSICEAVSNGGRGKAKVSNQVLQVIQNNLVPFLVDKFIELEEKMTRKMEQMEVIIKFQGQQIKKMKEREKVVESFSSLQSKNANAGLKNITYHQNDGLLNKKSITENNDQAVNEASISKISRLLEQLTVTMENTSTEQIVLLEKQVKKLAERQKIGQQKLEQQFAKRILELISTYNDNFVDLDKRITKIQGQFPVNSKIPISTTIDKQKTNRYDMA